ncbi:MAG: glycosyltransferase family 4 protein [Polyangiaceae bacterium]|nr:glycosyltransferase family 4 protein [Polyangiaceae bacterium]
MRIALVSTCAVSTPPAGYGGTELVVAELAKGLVESGHDVVLYATGDSTAEVPIRSLFETPVWPPDDLAEQRHAAFAFDDLRKRDIDVVHVNHACALPFRFTTPAPCVLTVHHDRIERLIPHYEAFPDVNFVGISERQAELSPEIPFARVIHHGIDTSLYPEGSGRGDYVAFLGRFCEDKGTHLAIDAAEMAGMPIQLGGAIHGIDDAQRYFEREVRPRLARLGERATWRGELSHEPKIALLSDARATLFPIQWEEPFGLVMIESMLVGTPVVAFRHGSAPEVVEEGVTGFIVDSMEEMSARLKTLGPFDRARCRARALERWSTQRMTRDYVDLYRELVERPYGAIPISTDGVARHGAQHSAR